MAKAFDLDQKLIYSCPIDPSKVIFRLCGDSQDTTLRANYTAEVTGRKLLSLDEGLAIFKEHWQEYGLKDF
ncbi:MAG: hypothetical protein R2865_11680 [Deinococcales bacterium]